MQYRSDIDGLRAISVISVILFHTGFKFLSGGYVGVDIFFVISGYLITGLVFDEIKTGSFTFAGFYKRRIARLLPALIITLFFVLIFGLLFYDNNAFDNLGKEIFFASIGAANILFGQGINYFAQDESVRPLIHLWSLGVEEQFYILWPTILIFLSLLKFKNILLITVILFFISFGMAILSVDNAPIETYFYPQYRAFELILGALTALGMRSQFFSEVKLNGLTKEIITYISLVLIVFPMFLLNKNSTFPGLNTLFPCIGASLFIGFSYRTSAAKVLGLPPLVRIGLISYPLYLYHQPIISYIHFFGLEFSKTIILIIVLLISITLSELTYRYIETPIRRKAHNQKKSSAIYMISLITSLSFISVIGLFIAKNNGVEGRFKVLNPFAYQVSKHNSTTFHDNFDRGMNVSKMKSRILFVGDSALQQYVYPISKAFNFEETDIDTVTRGGCVLLKDVDFVDSFSDISCEDLRNDLYKINERYEYLVISQDWDSYNDKIRNMEAKDFQAPLKSWEPFIDKTINHFKTIAKQIIIIGSHVKVNGTSDLKPTIFLSESAYRSKLSSLKVSNFDNLMRSRSFFEQWQSQNNVVVIHPVDIWLKKETGFRLHNKKWSFFSDSLHVSSASTEYIVEQMNSLLLKK